MCDDLLQPRYADRFRCIGADCEDTCCQGWGVYVDKATYKKYHSTPALRQLTAEHLERTSESRDDFKYGRIRLVADNRCPFLDADGLCQIQKKYGAVFLSKTCTRYPHACTRFGGRLQKGLLLSCPEAARLVLLSPQLLASESLETAKKEPVADDHSLPHQLRCFALGLLQDRSYPVWQRLFVLGIVCRRIMELGASKRAVEVPQLIGQYASMVMQGQLRDHLDGIPAQPTEQLDLVVRLIRLRFQLEPPAAAFATTVADFLQGIGYSADTSLERAAALYADAQVRYYQPFAQQYPAFLENYLVNYVFCTRFPFVNPAVGAETDLDPLAAFLLMAFHYRLLHSLLIGSAGRYREQFSSAQATRVVSAFARRVEHNVGFLKELSKLLDASDFQQTGNLALLLRN